MKTLSDTRLVWSKQHFRSELACCLYSQPCTQTQIQSMKILSDITTSKLCCEVQELALKQATAEMERMRRELEQLRQVAGKARAQVEGLEQQLEEKVQAASFNLTAFEGHKASGVVSVVRALTGFSVQSMSCANTGSACVSPLGVLLMFVAVRVLCCCRRQKFSGSGSDRRQGVRGLRQTLDLSYVLQTKHRCLYRYLHTAAGKQFCIHKRHQLHQRQQHIIWMTALYRGLI